MITAVLMATSIPQVNLRFFQTTFWNNIDLASTQAASDPAWRSLLTTRSTDTWTGTEITST